MAKNRPAQIEGMLAVLENGDLRGLKHCGDDFGRRGIPAVVTIGEEVIDQDPGLVKDLRDKGLEIGGKISSDSLCDETYEYQLEKMRGIQDKIWQCINKPMRLIIGRHLLHNEATVRVAHELGVNYVLIRGGSGTKAKIYKAKEYATTMVSVSMIPAKGTGTGSLCEHIPWAIGQTPEDFRQILFGLTEDKIVLGIHTREGGVKLRWWNVYQDFLNANLVTWKSLAEFAVNPIVLPYAQIPTSTELTYRAPTPQLPLEQEPEILS